MEEPQSAVAIVDSLLAEAYAVRASDIHLDPGSSMLTARFRVDGSLYDALAIPNSMHQEILARLKILAGLRTDEHQSPQDGRFRFQHTQTGADIDVRIAIGPTYYGENAVLRILSSRDSLSSLATLGFSTEQQFILLQALRRPHGMILITGPTGCGKTSTLYALLQLLNTRDTSIITIEDPIEYAIEGINQIPASSTQGLSFAAGLRSILRQDPNIIGIGEIRDAETATLATNAALTGHLVLSTLHTTDAPTALPRLIDMHVEPYVVASTVSLVISQRLVRRLCRVCKVRKSLGEDQEILLQTLANNSEIPFQMQEHFVSKGCSACGGSGSEGRVGLFEVMHVDATLQEAAQRKVSARELYVLAVQHGMVPLLHDGIRKAVGGIVGLDEVLALMTE